MIASIDTVMTVRRNINRDMMEVSLIRLVLLSVDTVMTVRRNIHKNMMMVSLHRLIIISIDTVMRNMHRDIMKIFFFNEVSGNCQYFFVFIKFFRYYQTIFRMYE